MSESSAARFFAWKERCKHKLALPLKQNTECLSFLSERVCGKPQEIL